MISEIIMKHPLLNHITEILNSQPVFVYILLVALFVFILLRKKLGKKRIFILIPLGFIIFFHTLFVWDAWDLARYDDDVIFIPIDETFSYRPSERMIYKMDEDIGVGGIPKTIKFYVNDDDFVLAKQQPKLGHSAGYPDEDWLEREYFWIIDLNQNEVIGPLSEDGFNGELARLNVAESLVGKFYENEVSQQ